jgi:hypothetical protein
MEFGEWGLGYLATSMLMLQQPDNTKKTLLLAPPCRRDEDQSLSNDTESAA